MIKLHNTKTRRKEDFTPIDAENVRMYVCGPTVYDRAHLGNARPVVVFDVLYRLLRHVYGADHVTYVRNFTDVDDKINAKAASSSRDIRDITDETIEWYHEDMDALGALRPDHEPRATEYIPQMITMISRIIKNGCAYTVQSHVGHNSGAVTVMMDTTAVDKSALFSVRDYDAQSAGNSPMHERYGTLSGRHLDDMLTRDDVKDAILKRDPMDFVLWKPSTGDQPGWESPWGFGRPGWHIECSAMSLDLLGESFDIHAGGLDLQFPHHENEIAQSCCANPHGEFAHYWLHNEMLQVEGKKMSKSLGNFFTVKDLLDQGVPGEVIRFVLLSTHYRSPMDWTEKKVREATTLLRDIWDLVSDCEKTEPDPSIVLALADDLNTPLAITHIHALKKSVLSGDKPAGVLLASMQLLGQFCFRRSIGVVGWGPIPSDQRKAAMNLARYWMGMRDAKDYKSADELKLEAAKLGIELSVLNKDGRQQGNAKITKGFDPTKLEALK